MPNFLQSFIEGKQKNSAHWASFAEKAAFKEPSPRTHFVLCDDTPDTKLGTALLLCGAIVLVVGEHLSSLQVSLEQLSGLEWGGWVVAGNLPLPGATTSLTAFTVATSELSHSKSSIFFAGSSFLTFICHFPGQSANLQFPFPGKSR